MFIDKINKFLQKYENIEKDIFLEIIKNVSSNSTISHKFEKDFLLTLILVKFSEKYPDLIFKGGTCLNKIYFPYFRLSEDLDFAINKDIGRTARKTLLKKYENDFIKDLGILGLKARDQRTKYDEYKLAMFTFEYNSIIDNSIQTIKIDISLKNRLFIMPYKGEIKSLFKDIILEESIFGSHYINCIDLKESIAEKLRASLTRGEPAIRDFFDIWYVREFSDFDFEDSEFKMLVNSKLEEVDYLYTLEENYDLLKKQINTDLKPVLNKDFEFNFDNIFNYILSFKK